MLGRTTLQISYTARCPIRFPCDFDGQGAAGHAANETQARWRVSRDFAIILTLTWTVYLIFLPGLAAPVGIRPLAFILVLMLNHAIFAVMDYLMG